MGILIAIILITCWLAHQVFMLMNQPVNLADSWFWINLLVQTWLFTGLFITAHDAMHGSISKHQKVNLFFGYVSTLLFAGMWYPNLVTQHRLHHVAVATALDPDYKMGNQRFFSWWFSFMRHYVTLWQILIMSLLFNIGILFFTQTQLLLLWILPSILSTFQLFYFGTFRPHRLPHTRQMEPYKARSQKRNHLGAFFCCYFFGYHYEHHAFPETPWWRLYKKKN
jgi:beta-carotene ketolase (CrtW type)